MKRILNDYLKPAFTRWLLAIWVTIAVLAAATGPFGTYESQTFGERFAYWGLVAIISSVMGSVFFKLATQTCGKTRPILCDLALTGMMVLFFSPILWLLTSAFFSSVTRAEDISFTRLAVYVAVVTACIAVIRRTVPGIETVGYFGTKSEAETLPRLHRRLPDGFDGSILRLTVRDHFVDVVSTRGTDTIRSRFGDAIDEMDGVEGFCTHRSHWVARHAIVGAQRNGPKINLRLINGDLVPVSRKYRPDLEEAGIL